MYIIIWWWFCLIQLLFHRISWHVVLKPLDFCAIADLTWCNVKHTTALETSANNWYSEVGRLHIAYTVNCRGRRVTVSFHTIFALEGMCCGPTRAIRHFAILLAAFISIHTQIDIVVMVTVHLYVSYRYTPVRWIQHLIHTWYIRMYAATCDLILNQLLKVRPLPSVNISDQRLLLGHSQNPQSLHQAMATWLWDRQPIFLSHFSSLQTRMLRSRYTDT